MSTQQIETSTTQQHEDATECARFDCTAPAEHSIYGVPLCMVDWLRDRVRLNLARLAS